MTRILDIIRSTPPEDMIIGALAFIAFSFVAAAASAVVL